MLAITDLIAGVFKPAAELIDELHTSDEERLKAKGHLLDVQAAAMQRVFDYEAETLKAKAGIVQAEAQSEHWITATWRPITMLTFLALIVARFFGWTAPNISEPEYLKLWDLVQIGLGGYVVGRSAEKIAPAIADVLKKK